MAKKKKTATIIHSSSAMAKKKKTTTTTSCSSHHRDWSDLPSLPLLLIFNLLPSLPDLSAFSSVCRSWRLLILSSPSLSSTHPPLLLRPVLESRLHRSRTLRWPNPLFCLLVSPSSSSHHSPLLPSALRSLCIGHAFGHLIFLRDRRTLIANAFTGAHIQPPDTPLTAPYTHAFLTAPTSSPSSRLILSGPASTLLTWQLDNSEHNFTEHPLPHQVVAPIRQLVSFKGSLLALDSAGRLLTLAGFYPQLTVEFREAPVPLPIVSFPEHLVECGRELLRVRFDHQGQLFQVGMEVYRLNTAGSAWVRVESLGNWCLFLDVRGKCASACSNPERWGGRSNSVYITGPGCDDWTVIPVDGALIDCLAPDSPFFPANLALPPWPTPLWVHPSMLF